MGLDTVELVLEVEEEFGIKIPDQDSEAIQTVGDLHRYISHQLGGGEKKLGICFSAICFYRIRRALRALGGPGLIRPGDKTDCLLPDHQRRSFWKKFEQAAGLRLPALVRPVWLDWFMGWGAIFGGVFLSWFIVWTLQMPFLIYLLVWPSGLLLWGLGKLVTAKLRRIPGRRFLTVRGLTESAVSLNLNELIAAHGAVGDVDIWATLKQIIVEQLGVRPDEVKPEANFVNDLL